MGLVWSFSNRKLGWGNFG